MVWKKMFFFSWICFELVLILQTEQAAKAFEVAKYTLRAKNNFYKMTNVQFVFHLKYCQSL